MYCVPLATLNTGRARGSILTSGVTKLYDCLLSGNGGYTGPAISNTVSLDIYSTEFEGNALLGGDAFFLDYANVSELTLANRARGNGYANEIPLCR